MPRVTSRQHAIVSECRAARRGDDPRLLLDGWHLLEDALAAGVRLDTIIVRHDVLAAHAATIDAARAAGARVLEATDGVMDAVSPVRASSGVVALATRPAIDPRSVTSPAPALVVVAFGVQDPGNVGALIRSVAAAGATGVLLDEASADPWGWKALRASMGSTFCVPIVRDDQALVRLASLRAEGLLIAAADPCGAASMYEASLSGPLALVFGAEGSGLPAAVLAQTDVRLRIPMRPRVESLNVAVAAALLVYEAARQRHGRDDR